MYNYSNAIFEYSEFFKFIDSSIMNGVPFERYSVSNYGRVYDNYLKEFPTIGCNEDGYLFVSLYINGQTIQFPIHELVGHYFVARYYSHRILRHIDGNKKNNFFMNLEWVYNGYQSTTLDMLSKPSDKVTRKDVELVCELLSERDLSQKDIAIASGLAQKVSSAANYVSNIYNGKIWKDISCNYNLKNIRYRKKKKDYT